MKKNVTYVDRGQFEAILTARSLPTKVQSGFIRVEGPKGNRLYVAATKKVGRVDISGFLADPHGVTPHCGIFGNVKQQMRMDGDEKEVLARFELVLDILLAQPEKVKEVKVKAPKAPRAAGEKKERKGWGAKKVATEDIAARLERIKEYAAATGMAISPKTLALCQSMAQAEE